MNNNVFTNAQNTVYIVYTFVFLYSHKLSLINQPTSTLN